MLKFLVVLLLSNTVKINSNILDCSDENASSENEDLCDIANKYADAFMIYLDNGHESDELKTVNKRYRQSDFMRFSTWNLQAGLVVAKQIAQCTACRIVAQISKRILQLNLTPTNTEYCAKTAFLYVCDKFNLQTKEVCTGIFQLNWPILYYILQNSKAHPETFCSILAVQYCNVKKPEFYWAINVDETKGPLLTAKEKPFIGNNGNDMVIIHLTDIHYDPEYLVNSTADCREPLCCRAKSTSKPNSLHSEKAGYWSDYRDCDAPLHMIQKTFQHIKQQHKKINYIYMTGDIVPHNVWSTTIKGNKLIMTTFYELLKQEFADTQIYPVLGNHEAHPVNVFGNKYLPSEFQSKWLYTHIWSLWQNFLPWQCKLTVLEGGYYTLSPQPGFRIIALNNNDAYYFNWWLYYDGNIHTSLPQLQWLHDILLKAEKENEYVHILSHIPSGGYDCWPLWAREFNRIIERFSHIIGGIFNGHSHSDEMQVHYSQYGHAMMVSWNGGSLTAHTFKNPNYRVYSVEPVTYQVTDHSTWIFNVTEDHDNDSSRKPNWFQEYKFSEFTNDLSPSGINVLLNSMTENPNLLRQFWKYKSTSAAPQLVQGCDDNCLLETICDLATSNYNERQQCEALKSKLKQSLSKS